MDGRRCSSYAVGFDACDPLGSVLEWSGRVPARVLRRRCRSEGLDRSPYEDGTRELRSADSQARSRALPNKSHYTLNNPVARFDRFQHECSRIAAENGDYLMAQEQHRLYELGYQSEKTRFNKSPSRPNGKADDIRLPKVDELLEKADHDMNGYTFMKQPLKSILNNPIPKSLPPSILKKPKCKYQDPKFSVDGRRRQRASSESDNLYCNYHYGSPVSEYDTRFTNYLSTNVKRVKDNSGVYTYSTTIHSSTPSQPHTKTPKSPTKLPNGHKTLSKLSNGSCKNQVIVTGKDEVHLLRTSVINDIVVEDCCSAELPSIDSSPTCPSVGPPPPVISAVTIRNKTLKKKTKAKPKVVKQSTKESHGAEGETEDAHSISASPDIVPEMCRMDTDILAPDQDKHDNGIPSNDSELMGKPNNKANGALKKTTSKEPPVTVPESISSCLRASLFPKVPPYLKFVSHEDGAPLKIPPAIQKHLKWKLTTITPIVVKKTLTNSGFRLVKSECDTSECPQEETVEWIGIWGKHMKSLMFRAIKDGQKMNHFPGTFQIGRKDRLWRNLQKLTNKFGIDEFGIMPKTYVLPHDLKLLKHDWEKHAANNEKWIIKPPASARGTGIKVVSRWTQIPKKRAVVVQRYVSAPYLINGNKFDMRLYVLVTSLHPLRIYLYKDGLARFASVKYNDELASLNDRYMHLTNYSINRLSKNYTPNEDFNACEGHKWTLQTLFQYLKSEKRVDTDALWESMKDLVIKTIISGEYSISSLTKANITSRYNCYELFGIDVLLDEDLKPWLLEVNISPSLHSASPLDIHVKGPLVTTVLNIAQYQVPAKTNLEMLTKEKPHKLAGILYDSRLYTVYLSKEERDKHIIYTNMEDRDMYLRDILSTLTPDDVRHLIQAEDELTQTGDMERIFPTLDTNKYLTYLAGPRYYNRLFDAWETRYATNRESGMTLLRNLCDIGYHLEVPPVPLKNDVDAPTPTASIVSAASITSVGSDVSPKDATPT